MLDLARRRVLRGSVYDGATDERSSSAGRHTKGAFILTSDGKRERWDVSGPHFGGWEIYHLKGSPADPNRLYASQSSGWFGQVIQRSNDGGQTWEPVDNKFAYDGVPGTHQWYDGTPHPWEFKRVWHLEPSLTDPDTVYAGVEDAALFRTTDGGRAGTSCRACAGTDRARTGSPARAGCACTRSCSTRRNPQRMFIAISAAGAFRTDDGGADVEADQPRAALGGHSRTRRPKSATASTASPCTGRGRTCSSCRSTGTSCGATTAATRGAR